ncbi:nucleoplasmin-like [Catharus ustulatus]|uniref:nucleoplasmin-like n=1 Tax=Catharus ustulatus TaxID=91951 RepID=UPI00140DB8FA|nr:nucleoplasmin-like [Catharus ustulatus]
MSFSDSSYSRDEKPVPILWGCELSSARSSHTFQVPEDWSCDQQLVLCTICLGETARDEFHVVEVTAEDSESCAPVPLATLKPSVLPMATLDGMELSPPATFRLRAGSGPVYISGQLMSLVQSSDEDDEEEEEEAMEEPQKKPPKGSGAQKGSTAEKRKLEKEDELNSLAPKAPLPSKGRGAGRGKKAATKK